MAMSLGKSFMPGADQPNGVGGAKVTPVQTAIKLLSLRLPSVVGARALAPQALLQGEGGAGLGGGQMGVDAAIAFLRRLMQQSGAQPIGGEFGPMSAMTPGVRFQTPRGMPAPTVTPGQQTGEGPLQPVNLPEPFQSGTTSLNWDFNAPERKEPEPSYGGFPVSEGDYWRG